MGTVDVKIYSASWCSYCKKLKDFLRNRGISYEEIDIDEQVDEAMTLIELDLKTIPQVFLDGEYLGGCDVTIKYFNNKE